MPTDPTFNPYPPGTISPSQRTDQIEKENKRLREEIDQMKKDRDAADVEAKRLRQDNRLLEDQVTILHTKNETLKWVIERMTG
jgi:chromosome segregation ATPase